MTNALTVRRSDRPATVHSPTADFDLRPLLGEWTNYDGHSTGILALSITERQRVPVLHVHWAAAAGTDDRGGVLAAAFTAGVTSGEAVGFLAQYDTTDRNVLLAAYLNKRLLVVDAYHRFAGPDGHANLFQRDHLYCLPPSDRSSP